MRSYTLPTNPTLSTNPCSWGIVRCWIPGSGNSSKRSVPNTCFSSQGINDNSDGATLILGTGVNCTAGDGPTIIQGSNNNLPYLSFDGTNDSARCRYLANPVIPEIASAQQVTFALGFRRIATSTSSMQFGFSETTNGLCRIRLHSNGNVYFDLTGGSGRNGSFACNDLNWHLVVFTYDGSQGTDAGKVQGYLDGTPMSLTFAGTLPSSIVSANGSCWMGFDDTDNTSKAGHVNFASIWARHLEKSDVSYLYEEWTKGYPTFLRNPNIRRSVGWDLLTSSTAKGRVFKSPVITGISFI